MFDDQNSSQTDRKALFTKYVIPGLGILALLSVVFAGSLYFAQRYTNILGTNDSSDTSSAELSPEEIEKLVNRVSDLILLPAGETPDVATVNDLSQVRSQDFFRNAEVGDKVLIYASAKKAYLYRPDTHKLIEVGIVSRGNPDGSAEGSQNSQPEIITPTPIPTTGPIEILPSETPAPSPTASPAEL